MQTAMPLVVAILIPSYRVRSSMIGRRVTVRWKRPKRRTEPTPTDPEAAGPSRARPSSSLTSSAPAACALALLPAGPPGRLRVRRRLGGGGAARPLHQPLQRVAIVLVCRPEGAKLCCPFVQHAAGTEERCADGVLARRVGKQPPVELPREEDR